MKTCIKEGCLREAKARNLCRRHYYQFLKNDVNRPKCSDEECSENAMYLGLCNKHYLRYIYNESTDRPKCAVKNCNKKSRTKGLCTKHYTRVMRNVDVSAFSCYDPNQYVGNDDGTHTVVITDKYGKVIGEAIIDSDQLAKVSYYKWCLSNGYVITHVNKKTKYLHQIIFPVPDGYVTDHIDRNPLNNRLSNLRKCFHRENIINCNIRSDNNSGFIGVYYRKDRRKWVARIGIIDCSISLGSFHIKDEAIIASLRAEKKYFGEFAPQKHLYKEYGIK